MKFFSERTIEIEGVQVRVREAGDGPALVILGQTTPTPLDGLLADRARVLILPTPTGVSLPAPPGAIARAAGSIGIKSFTPMAHGAVSAAALTLAAHEPALVRSVVLLGPTPFDGADPDLAKVTMPVLALFGTRDDTSAARHWRAGLANCHVVMVYDAGPDLTTDRPEAVADVVLDFLEQADRFLVTRASGIIHP
jgi:pimeloyl-ACP methyl ester carboxylesterase